jgi:predicted Zn finger-like uncharacterized protein
MLIVCPNCETSYDVSAASLGAEGRQVRCVRCREVWFATPAAESSPAAAATGAVDALAAAAADGGGADAAAADAPMDEDPAPEPASDEDLANLAVRAAGRAAADAAFGRDPAADAALASHDSPPLAPDAGGLPGPPHDIETVAARRARRAARKAQAKPRRRLAIIIVPLVAAHIALVGWRSDVVRSMPGTGRLFAAIGLGVNLRGIAITDVTTTKEANESVSVLVVQGVIANVSRQPHEIPRLRLALRNAAGSEVYSWTALPERATLGPGDSEPFQTRLASPPAEARDLVVRFFTRRDLAGGVR